MSRRPSRESCGSGIPSWRAALVVVSALVVAKEAYALGPDQVIPIYQASAPGSEAATQTESRDLVFGEPRLRNVTHPTLSVYLPRPGVASGAAVIIAPGGGFMMLSVQSEGEQVAHWLMRHGVAAIVLKYRLNEAPSTSRSSSRI